MEMDEEQEKMEQAEDHREERQNKTLAQLNKFRQDNPLNVPRPTVQRGSNSTTRNSRSTIASDSEAPSLFTGKKNEVRKQPTTIKGAADRPKTIPVHRETEPKNTLLPSKSLTDAVEKQEVTVVKPKVSVEKPKVSMDSSTLQAALATPLPESPTSSSSGSNQKKKKTFQKLEGLGMPQGIGKWVNSLKAPLSQIENMMESENQLDQEDWSNVQQRHSLRI
jgi:hypothetical protein